MQSVPTEAEFNSLALSVKTIADRVSKLEQTVPIPIPTPPPTNVLLEDNFDTPYDFNSDNQVSPDGKWKMKYLSGGKTYVRDGVLTTYPSAATSANSTFSTLVLSTQSFKNFQFDVDMKTNKMLRTGANKYGGNGPNSWETAWIFWRYDDAQHSTHHYYFVLKTDGYEFGKKDNAVGDTSPEKQIFIKTGSTPRAVVGTSYHITVKAVDYKFTISVNGAVVVDMVDPKIYDPSKMDHGFIGLYEEDSNASFDNVKVVAL